MSPVAGDIAYYICEICDVPRCGRHRIFAEYAKTILYRLRNCSNDVMMHVIYFQSIVNLESERDYFRVFSTVVENSRE
jgi:hypothetical protein